MEKEEKRWKEEIKRAFPFFAIDIPQTYYSIYIIYNTVYTIQGIVSRISAKPAQIYIYIYCMYKKS